MRCVETMGNAYYKAQVAVDQFCTSGTITCLDLFCQLLLLICCKQWVFLNLTDIAFIQFFFHNAPHLKLAFTMYLLPVHLVVSRMRAKFRYLEYFNILELFKINL